jgi:hypothetical protein
VDIKSGAKYLLDLTSIALMIKLQKGNNCTSTQLRETEHGTY